MAQQAEMEKRLRTGRPLGDDDWTEKMEKLTGRKLRPAKRGPKRR